MLNLANCHCVGRFLNLVCGEAKPLGTYRIQGHKAHMFGYCGLKGEKSCKVRNIGLVLEWNAGQNYYVTFSSNEWRRTLAGFSRSLHRL